VPDLLEGFGSASREFYYSTLRKMRLPLRIAQIANSDWARKVLQPLMC